MHSFKIFFNFFVLLLCLSYTSKILAAGNILDKYNIHDLSHLVPLFEPLHGELTKSDISKPIFNSQPIAGSGGRLGVRTIKPRLGLKNGFLQWGFVYLEEHYSTHVDSTDHFITTNKSLMTVPNPDQRSVGAFELDELIGPIVYIDITDRVQLELSKNNGKPSRDTLVTNFDNDSGNNVQVADIEAIADQLVDGSFLVLNVGWEQFYIGPPPASGDNWEHPYNNNLNHPGITPAAVDRLIAIENKRDIRLGGFVANNIAVESGHSIRGDMSTEKVIVPNLIMYLHAVGLPRGWKIVENAANLSVLNNYDANDCDLVVGAPRIVGASGTPSRVMAICKK